MFRNNGDIVVRLSTTLHPALGQTIEPEIRLMITWTAIIILALNAVMRMIL
jgi:hypothetical protein